MRFRTRSYETGRGTASSCCKKWASFESWQREEAGQLWELFVPYTCPRVILYVDKVNVYINANMAKRFRGQCWEDCWICQNHCQKNQGSLPRGTPGLMLRRPGSSPRAPRILLGSARRVVRSLQEHFRSAADRCGAMGGRRRGAQGGRKLWRRGTRRTRDAVLVRPEAAPFFL